MVAVAYLRVSTSEQATSGLGLEAQSHGCRTWASREGLEVAGEYRDEGVSGGAPIEKRPGLLDAVAALAKGDALVVAKRDRLGRDPIAVAMIEAAVTRRGARVVSAAGEGTQDDSPTSILMRRIVDAFAEYERMLIRARTRAALASKRRRGERAGQVAFGQALADDGVKVEIDAGEVELIGQIGAMRDGGLSLRRIACELDRLGVRPKNGGPRWSHQAVAKILTRAGTAGTFTSKGAP